MKLEALILLHSECCCIVTWFCYHLIAKPGNKTATPPWSHPYPIKMSKMWEVFIRARRASNAESVFMAWHQHAFLQYLNMHNFSILYINTLRPRQNGRHFSDDIFRCIFLNGNVWTPIKISVKFVPKGPNNNIQDLVQIMAWHRPGDKPLSEPMMVRLPTHICVTRPQWVKSTLTMASPGWGLLSQFPLFHYFPIFHIHYHLTMEYHHHIWQVSPQLCCRDTWKIWMHFE